LTVSPIDPDPQASTRIQVLRTIAPNTYPHTAAGDESIKEAMLNLIGGATESIYFENQYFFDGDIVAAIRTAAKRGVPVVGLLCRRPDAGQAVGVLEDFLDAESEARLQWTSLNPVIRNYIQIYSPVTTGLPTKDIYVHAKLMIVDDRYVLLGSANIAFPSLEFHSEMCTLVEDAARAGALRRTLFAEHLCLEEDAIPAKFVDAALLWHRQGLENKALVEANQASRSRVLPQSPLSPLDSDVR
jgi:phosphatidylserine/phosphatidylglycerophosphate/cardiolipin synthase-like enzyme